MRNSKELKKKIEDILEEYNFETDNGWILDTEEMADAIIAAVIGDVKDLQAQVNVLEITNIALQAGYDDAEKDRLYWVDKYKEAEHRAEVAERAVYNMAYGQWQREGARRVICEKYAPSTVRDYLARAEKELERERKE